MTSSLPPCLVSPSLFPARIDLLHCLGDALDSHNGRYDILQPVGVLKIYLLPNTETTRHGRQRGARLGLNPFYIGCFSKQLQGFLQVFLLAIRGSPRVVLLCISASTVSKGTVRPQVTYYAEGSSVVVLIQHPNIR